nr:MAG TPA: hypothetical protein [Caudoviricetes sp.]
MYTISILFLLVVCYFSVHLFTIPLLVTSKI